MGAPPSPIGAAWRLALRMLRGEGQDREGRAAGPRRRAAVEYQGFEAAPRRLSAYLRVTGGREGGGAEPRDERDLSPALPGLWEMGLAVELFAAGHVPFPSGGLIQLASERVQLRPLRAGDQVRCRVELDRVDPYPKGLQITLVSRNWNASGQLCSQNTLRLLARQRGTAPVQRPRSAPSTTAADAGEWKELTRWKLRSNHGRRYARVSGDYNPIHLWSWSSRPFGYARPILQGCCTEALVAHALIHHLLNDEIAALRKLRIDFRSPLLLPSEVQLSIAMHPEETGGLFRVTDAQASERIFAEGSFVGRGASSGVHPAR